MSAGPHKLLVKLSALPLRVLAASIRAYQATLSPDHGWLRPLFPHGVCRFTPTCSQYAHEAVSIYGWRGVLLAIRRVLRCHPFLPGGHDPVPKPGRS